MTANNLTLTLDDLRQWRDSGSAPCDPRPLIGVIGDPIDHSLSPAMQQPAIDEAGIEGSYVKIHIPKDVESLDECFALLSELKFQGTNVTIPHKEAALAAATTADPISTMMGVANTILFLPDGTSKAYNTDGIGFAGAVRDAFVMDLRDLRIAIIGTGGGAGKAAAIKCAMDGCERLVMVNRTVEKILPLAEQLGPYFRDDRLHGPSDRIDTIALADTATLEDALEEVDLIVNATSLGLKRGDGSPLPAHLIRPHHMVFDMIYAPPKTPLLIDAEEQGARTANGAGMLAHQGAASFAIWFGKAPPVATMKSALAAAMQA